ncbi:hypothetical protein [Scatolibacter rhodanostii]|nr:hypothetical protein [Scatolibacter rhodanostii]
MNSTKRIDCAITTTQNKKDSHKSENISIYANLLVGVTGLEPAAS